MKTPSSIRRLRPDGRTVPFSGATVSENQSAPVQKPVQTGRESPVSITAKTVYNTDSETGVVTPTTVTSNKSEQFADVSMSPSTSSSNYGQLLHQQPILEMFLPSDLFNDANNASSTTSKSHALISQIYRDMYYHDPICGSAVDIMSNLPFSDFVLSGVKDSKTLDPFYESIGNMRIKSLLPSLSVDYLVQGLFVGTLMKDESKKVYSGIVPQNVDNVDIRPVPIYGRDPMVVLRVGDALKSLARSDDKRVKTLVDELKAHGIDPEAKEHFPEPDDVIYIPRRAMMRDARGASLYRRLLTYWLMEKSLFRGTLDQASKRQKAIVHMIVGDAEWTPTGEELSLLADTYMQAQQDPVGAVFVTRSGVQLGETSAADSFWKISDMADFFTQYKYKALGISEAFIDGTASYNAMDQVMTTFVENLRNYRATITQEVFYDKVFPSISKMNGFKRRSHASSSNRILDVSTLEGPADFDSGIMSGFLETASMTAEDSLIPQVNFLKRLRPEADAEYMNMLDLLSQKGVPIPLRIQAAAAGQDIDSFLDSAEEDIKLHERVKEWKDQIKEAGGGGEGEGEGMEFANMSPIEVLANMSNIDPSIDTSPLRDRMGGSTVRLGLGNRDFSGQDDTFLSRQGGTDFAKLSPKGRKMVTEKMNNVIAEIAAEVGRVENLKTLEEHKDAVDESGTRHYSSSHKSRTKPKDPFKKKTA